MTNQEKVEYADVIAWRYIEQFKEDKVFGFSEQIEEEQ